MKNTRNPHQKRPKIISLSKTSKNNAKSTRNDAKVMDLYGYTHTQPVRTYRPQIETKNQKSTSDFPKFRNNIPRSAKPENFIKNYRETVEITSIVFLAPIRDF